MAVGNSSIDLSSNSLVVLFLMAVRMGAILISTPVLGARTVPAMTKISLALILAFVLLPTVQGVVIPQTFGEVAVAVGKELLVGLMAGMAATLVFTSLQVAAAVAGIQIGFGFSNTVDSSYTGQTPVLDHLFTGIATLIFLSANLHHPFLLGLKGLFDAVPVNGLNLSRISIDGLIALGGNMFLASMRIVLPLLGALLLTDVALAVMSRTAPQMNVFFVGMPIKIAIGLMAIIVLLPFLATHVESLIGGISRDMAIVMRYR